MTPAGWKRAAALAVPLALAAWLGRPLAALVCERRASFVPAYVDQGEALNHGFYPAPGFLISARLPVEPLLEARLAVHGAAADEGRFLFLAALLSLGLAWALGAWLGSGWTGWASAALCGAWWMPIWTPEGDFHKTFLLTLYVLSCACAAACRARRPSRRADMLLAAALGSSLLLRSTFAFLPPLLLLYDRLSRAQRPKGRVLLLLVPYLFLAPWIAMNGIRYGAFVPFEKQTADSNVVTAALGLPKTAELDVTALVGGSPRPESVLRWAATEIARHPLRYARGCFGRLFFVFRLYPVLFALALLAVYRRRRDEAFRHVGLLCAYYAAVHCLMSVEERYFVPLRPVLAALAAGLVLGPPAAADRDDRAAIVWTDGAALLGLCLSLFALEAVTAHALALGRGLVPEQALEQALARPPHDAWLLHQRAKAALTRGAADEAARDLASALELQPSLPGARLDLAWALAQRGKPALLSEFGTPARGNEAVALHFYRAAAKHRARDETAARQEIEAALGVWRAAEGDRGGAEVEDAALAAKLEESSLRRFAALAGPLLLTPDDRAGLAAAAARAPALGPSTIWSAPPAQGMPAAGFAEDEAGRRYFYEDVHRPFFAPDPARPGFYCASRPNAAPGSFAMPKPAGTFRVFVIGGSIARLFMSEEARRSLPAALQAALPARRVEVLDCGMPGYDGARELLIEREVLGYAPDLIVLLTGHNEGLASPPAAPWLIRLRNLLRRWSWTRALSDRWSQRPPADPAAAALERRRTFETNLRESLRLAARRGSAAAAIVPPLNYRDAAPAGPAPSGPAFARGWARWLGGDCAAALTGFAASAESDAHSLYYQARCQERLGRAAAARDGYERAAAADAAAGRCARACQDAIRRAAKEEGAALADVDAEFRRAAGGVLPGLELFSDAVHWQPRLNQLAVLPVVDALRAALPAWPWDAAALERLRADWRKPEAYSAADEDRSCRYGLAAVAVDGAGGTGLAHRGLSFLRASCGRGTGGPAQVLRRLAPAGQAPLGAGRAWGQGTALPSPAAAFRHWGLLRLEQGRCAEALEFFSRSLKDQPLPEAWIGKAAALARLGRKAEAAAALEQTLAAASSAGKERLAEYSAQAAELAAQFGLRNVKFAPLDESERLLSQAAALLKAGDKLKAAEELKKIPPLAPERSALRLRLALLWSELEDYQRALALLRTIAGAELETADVSLRAGDQSGARRALAAAEAAFRDDDEGLRRAAMLYQRIPDYDKALALLALLEKRRPNDAGLRRDRGVCQFGAGRGAEAAASLEEALKLDPRLWDAYLSLGAVYLGQGRRADALALYDRALALPPGTGAENDLRRRIAADRKEAAGTTK